MRFGVEGGKTQFLAEDDVLDAFGGIEMKILRLCLYCNDLFIGSRVDKKYCTRKCKTNYHNLRRSNDPGMRARAAAQKRAASDYKMKLKRRRKRIETATQFSVVTEEFLSTGLFPPISNKG